MKKYILIIAVLFAFVSCEEENIVFDSENGQTFANFSESSILVPTPAEGASTTVDVFVTTKADSDRTISLEVDPSSTATADQYTISGLTIPAGAFQTTLTITSNFDALPDLGRANLVLNLVDVSDPSNDLVLTETPLALEFFRECPITPGDWVINMTDSYGDGWQTTDGNGGDGLTITLNDGTIFEVGLCSPYAGAAGTFLGDGECTPNNGSEGTVTITIPEGTESAEWFFPGDQFGEIGFEIISPNGNVAGGYESADAGSITVDYCK
ncbi:hypothetical protein [uncultured Maribacter sp.]|uniref:hypothetical protein n=1 Tax=uncultured Maribacter sp. TaxID=431308 RepID=UPI0030ED08FD|tara:strand:- start:9819 stop:10622 length:804 start_codon:yes stop_codon:yes gene_type:complete